MNHRTPQIDYFALITRSVRIGTVVSFSFYCLLAIVSGTLIKSHESIMEEILLVSEARAEILRLDELLTMSAYMVATTGDPMWEARHHENAPRLDQAILRAEQFGGAPPDALNSIRLANEALLADERLVFTLARAGHLEESRRILSSDAYVTQKQAYTAGVSMIDAALAARVAEARLDVHRNHLVAILLFATSLITMLITGRTFTTHLSSLHTEHLRANLDVAQAQERAALVAMVADIGLLQGDQHVFHATKSAIRLVGLDLPADTPLTRSNLPPLLDAALTDTSDTPQMRDLTLEISDGQSVLIRGRVSRERFEVAIIDVSARVEAERAIRNFADSLEARVRARTAELEEHVARNRLLALQVTEAETAERRRISNLLHEDLQQYLVATRLHALSGAPVAELVHFVDSAIQVTRTLATDLAPPSADRDLTDAVSDVCALFRRWHRLDVNFEAFDKPETAQSHIDVCHSVVRELLFNVVKHTGGAKASVRLTSNGDTACIVVCDNGPGFDPKQPSGMGLPGIHHRISTIAGTLKIESRLGHGTQITIRIPLRVMPASDLRELN